MVKLSKTVYDAVNECIQISQTNAYLLFNNRQQGVKHDEQ